MSKIVIITVAIACDTTWNKDNLASHRSLMLESDSLQFQELKPCVSNPISEPLKFSCQPGGRFAPRRMIGGHPRMSTVPTTKFFPFFKNT